MKNPKILILDSDINIAGILREHIIFLGHKKVFLSTSKEIIDDLSHKCFDYMLIDSEAIDEQSFQCLRNLADAKPKPCLILLYTGSRGETAERLTGLSFDFWLRKPFDFVLLHEIFGGLKHPEKANDERTK